ncbi:metallophosphoesterase family protein [Larkinella knui]|uniref:Metallophosphoesterase n=1 Tax=Larkinella knui TaxID=2025310 RepID=A0A3P1CDG1_9BACT|nr:metallophosphoesterase family protein [Larkinella knui]RRB11342.1 metallophosphoesterase [Larkinella knui]
MLKIAVISDIHANLPALQAVLSDIENRQADQLFCLGDLVDFAPWPNEVVDLIRQNRIPTLMGNHDERIAFDLPLVPLLKHSAAETSARVAAIDYTRQQITPENKAFLASLPRQFRLNFSFPDASISVLLTHASPRSIDEYIYENHDPDDLMAMMDDQKADVLIMGHTHQSYRRTLPNRPGFPAKTAINCGSVGRSKEAQPLATYLLITTSGAGERFGPDSITYELIRVEYPVEHTIDGIRQSAIPDFYANFLARALPVE